MSLVDGTWTCLLNSAPGSTPNMAFSYSNRYFLVENTLLVCVNYGLWESYPGPDWARSHLGHRLRIVSARSRVMSRYRRATSVDKGK